MDDISLLAPTSIAIAERRCFIENKEIQRGPSGYNTDADNCGGEEVEEEEERQGGANKAREDLHGKKVVEDDKMHKVGRNIFVVGSLWQWIVLVGRSNEFD
ncbi:unnamed protein product [Dovyalis caffra]|uniref:Uncharacterized protein n=1 Tax=Dovyalis caffra TaxID=77055 RepID=A0AAV1REW4_9ROSI|nr:unnamed protein product [Dovyalis caffra]